MTSIPDRPPTEEEMRELGWVLVDNLSLFDGEDLYDLVMNGYTGVRHMTPEDFWDAWFFAFKKY